MESAGQVYIGEFLPKEEVDRAEEVEVKGGEKAVVPSSELCKRPIPEETERL